MSVDDAAWAEIKRLWLETDLSARALADKFAVSASSIARRARTEGWTPHPSRAERSAAASRQAAIRASRKADESCKRSAPLRRRKPVAPEVRVRRMLAIIDLQLEQLERDMTSGEELTVQDKERLGRQFSGAIGSLEKVMEVASEHEKARTARGGDTAESRRTADDLRHEIAERLDRLNAQWLAHEKPR